MDKTAKNTTVDPRNNITASEEVKYKGVRKRKWGKYVTEVRLPNSRERIWLGSYDTAEKAARAFDAALFCLRGHRANLNFPDDLPVVPSGGSLSPDEIRAVAQRHANMYDVGSSHHSLPLPPQEAAANSEGADPTEDLIDWSFLDVLDKNVVGGDGNYNAGSISDYYGFFTDPGDDMYYNNIQPHFDESDDDDDDGHGNVPSFLWNF